MLNDILCLYFKHQQPPGSSFFEQGQYELVQGPDRRRIRSAQWDSTVAPGDTVEMSIQVEVPHLEECPRCHASLSASKSTYGWKIWQEFVLHVWKLYLSHLQPTLPEALQQSNNQAFLRHKQRGKVSFALNGERR
jgi:hypothetical protein